MLKRFKIGLAGTNLTFNLPTQYAGGPISLYINGQLFSVQDDTTHPYGYTLDEIAKTFTFYTSLYTDDFIYVIYDSNGLGESATDFSGSGLMKLQPGFNLISYQGAKEAIWDATTNSVAYNPGVLANIQNLFVDQIESMYGVPINTIVREFQTFETDTGKYRTYNTSSTSPSWVGDASHVTNTALYRLSANDGTEFGDPNDNNYISYNPNNFILSNCYIDGAGAVQSLDIDNNIVDLAAGLRTGILVYIHPTADLSLTNGLLELWF